MHVQGNSWTSLSQVLESAASTAPLIKLLTPLLQINHLTMSFLFFLRKLVKYSAGKRFSDD
jgi:hypothetical protein